MGLAPAHGRTVAEALIRQWCRTNLPQFDGIIANLQLHLEERQQWDFAAGVRGGDIRPGVATIDQNHRVRVDWDQQGAHR